MMTNAIRPVMLECNPETKMAIRRAPRGILSVEYAAMIAIFVAALVVMSIYVTRAVSGRMRDAGDVFGGGRQAQY